MKNLKKILLVVVIFIVCGGIVYYVMGDINYKKYSKMSTYSNGTPLYAGATATFNNDVMRKERIVQNCGGFLPRDENIDTDDIVMKGEMLQLLNAGIGSYYDAYPEVRANIESRIEAYKLFAINTSDKDVERITNIVGAKYDISPRLLQAIIWYESANNPNAINKDSGCVGYMQIYTKYHKDRIKSLGVTDIKDGYSNILVGADILKEYLNLTHNDILKALMIYNGDSNVRTDGYVSKYANNVYQLYMCWVIVDSGV